MVANKATKVASKAAPKAARVARAVRIKKREASKIQAARKTSSKEINLRKDCVVVTRLHVDAAVMNNISTIVQCYTDTPIDHSVGVSVVSTDNLFLL